MACIMSFSLYKYWCGQSGGRQYCSLIAAAPEDADWENLEMHNEDMIMWSEEMYLESTIVQVWRCNYIPRSSGYQWCTWRPWSRGFRDAFGGWDNVIQRCTWRPRSSWTQRDTWRLWSSEFGDACGGLDLETQWCTWRLRSCWTQRCTRRAWSSEFGDANGGDSHVTQGYTLRPWLSQFGYALWGRDCVTQRCPWGPWSSELGDALGRGGSAGGRSEGRCNASWESNHWLTPNCGNVASWVQ